jgi:CrcB protein
VLFHASKVKEGMMKYAVVFLGAGIGGALRHGVNIAALRLLGAGFPFGTMFINVSGSFLMGLLTELLALRLGLSQHWRLFITTGFLGGYTTFSTFSLETTLLWERGQVLQAAFYAGASVILGIGALIGALWLVRAFVLMGG